jgi:phosphoserine phosphatase
MPEPTGRPLVRGFDVIVFDCDSTLTAIEGVDELARMKGLGGEVAVLTEASMAGDVPLEAIYGRRLELLDPTDDDLVTLAAAYQANVVPDARAAVAALQAAGRHVYIVSGGLAPVVQAFGSWLGVPVENIMAVPVDGAADAPLARSGGKPLVVGELLRSHEGRSVLIGDGATDLEAQDTVDAFAAFAGVIARPSVIADADLLITGDSLAPIVGLALTEDEEAAFLDTEHRAVVGESRRRIAAGELVALRERRR